MQLLKQDVRVPERTKRDLNTTPPVDVVLIYPYFYTHVPRAMLFHPLGIAQLSSLLRREGLNVQVVDCTFLKKEEALSRIEAAAPKIVGIYIMLSMSDNAFMLASEIRNRLPQTLIACGGPLPTLKPHQYFPVFNLVFRGEAVDSFPGFCDAYIKEKSSLQDMPTIIARSRWPGLYYQSPHNGTIFSIPPQHSDEDRLNTLPIADRSDYEHLRYQQFWYDREGFAPATIMTSYGCPFDCDFCSKPIFGNRLRRRRMDNLFEEIRYIKEMGYDGLWIADDCFTLDLDHVRSFCRRMLTENLDMKWICLSRVDSITTANIKLMQQAGCHKVFFGLESGNNEVLRLMNKKTTVEAAQRTLHLFSESNIQTAGFFMVGYPGETYETIEETFNWALSLPLDEISFTVPYPLPGTRLFEKMNHSIEAADWQYENENRMVYASEFDEHFLKCRIEEVYEAFNNRLNRRSEAKR
jgi:anaerobic magnesium-protoporphyrin IX monomethyl ester cyclase